ncbi:hypothetical protein WJX73_007979 [Symbiochloris irregularis]|uniref:Uncharacterized protein n=1 Tax=Symbiochloris irregularis TaxID=706552 RepID=A0AAW1NRA2_9CHLO
MVTGAHQQSFLPSQYSSNTYAYGGNFPSGAQQPASASVRRGYPLHEYRGAQDAQPRTCPQLLPSLLDASGGPLLGLKLKKSPSALDWFQQQLDQQQRGQQVQQPPVLQQQPPVQVPVQHAAPAVAGVMQPAAPLATTPLPTIEPHTSDHNQNESMGTSFEETLEDMDFTSSLPWDVILDCKLRGA